MRLAPVSAVNCLRNEIISVVRYDEEQVAATHLTLWRRSSPQGAELDDLDGVLCRPGRRGRGGRPYPIYLGALETDAAAAKGGARETAIQIGVSVVSAR